ncbi:MAG: enolase C-terminal domain-like protein [Desulfobacterales bacterium]|nr:enolase C-terminal domain-like protein [Desulfobacterales bacterium]
MKINKIELFHISIPFAEPYKLSKAYGTLYNAEAVIMKLHTVEGIVGLGEADPLNPFSDDTPATVMVVTRDQLAPHLLGQDPTHISAIETNLDMKVRGNLMARGAINMALFDVVGKANGIPAYMLLGGLHRLKLPLLAPIGSGTPGEDEASIQQLIKDGYRTVMIKMGALPIADEIKRMTSAKARFGDQMSIIIDANQGWTVAETLEFIDGIRGSRPDLLEQPIEHDDVDGLKRIRNRAPCPLSADESVASIREATTLIREQAVDAFSIKVSKNGGLSKAKKIAELAHAFGLKVLMNSMFDFGITQAASLQLGCALPNLLDIGHAYMSVLRMSDDITDFDQNISNGIATIPTGPGLGINLDEDKLQKYTKDYLKIA